LPNHAGGNQQPNDNEQSNAKQHVIPKIGECDRSVATFSSQTVGVTKVE
jgi:hypothetical protein